MKTLFITFDKDFLLHTEGTLVVLNYDLLNDLFFELGAELVFLSKCDLSTDKAKLITDFEKDRSSDFMEFSKILLNSATTALLKENTKLAKTIEFELPDSYVEWLKFHQVQEYNAIGKKISSTGDYTIKIELEDIVESLEKFLRNEVKRVVESDPDIKKFTFVEAFSSDNQYVKEISALRDNLVYEDPNSAWILCEIGTALFNGIGTAKDIPKSIQYYNKAVEKGNGVAANWLGWCYQIGNGIEKDESKALKYYIIGSKLGNVSAHANAGYCYHLGIGTSIDYSKAESYYTKGAENGITFAQANLANIYYDGYLGEPDFEKAFKWYSEASKSNNNAQFKAGEMLLKGIGVTIDTPRGLELLKTSAIEGNVQAALLYAKEICKTSEIKAIQEACAILDTCERGKRMDERNPEVFYVHGEIIYKYFSDDAIDDAIQELKYARDLGYEPALTLLNEIEQNEKEKRVKAEKQFTEKMERLMKKAIYSFDERKFLEGEVEEDELEGCTCFPPKDWEKQFITSDKFGIKYNHRYHRLVSGAKSVFNWRYVEFQKMNAIDDNYLSSEEIYNQNSHKILWAKQEVEAKFSSYGNHYAIEDGTIVICRNAFDNCTRISSISLPQSLKSIGDLPTRLKELTIPQSVEDIFANTFFQFTDLETITILNGNINIIWAAPNSYNIEEGDEVYTPDELFQKCENLKKIYIPSGFIERFTCLFPAVQDKLEEIHESLTSEKKENRSGNSVDSQGELESRVTIDKNTSKSRDLKRVQSKKTKIVDKADEEATKPKGREQIVTTPKTKKALTSANNKKYSNSPIDEENKYRIVQDLSQQKEAVYSSNNHGEKKNTESLFAKLKNLFK